MQAVNQPVVHDEVHAAVTADLAGLGLDVEDDRVFVPRHQRLTHLLRHETVGVQVLVVGHARIRKLVGVEGIALNGVFVGESLRAGQLVHAAVRTGRVDIVFEQDRAALLGLDQRRRMVGVGEFFSAQLLAGEFQPVDRAGVHRHQAVHLVAAVDVEQLAGGTEAVRGVDVAAVIPVEFQTPAVLIVVPESVEVVDIRTFDMENVPEQSLPGHVERRQLEEIVNAVFEHHAVLSCLFGRIYQLPTLCVFSAVFTSCQHSSSDVAAGTSTATCLPCSMA